jgi:short-subunit dehydrogenase
MKKILITGSNSGLGKHLVSKFKNEGFDVFEHNGRNHYNLENHLEVKKLATDAKNFGVNILLNNAAIVCPSKRFYEYTEEEIIRMIEVNLTAPVLLSYYLIDQLTDIININSMVGLEIKSPRTLYSATKWGLRGFSQSLNEEIQNENLNILDVYPTNIKTTPDRENSMDVNFVVDSIFKSFIEKEKKLILDGRK